MTSIKGIFLVTLAPGICSQEIPRIKSALLTGCANYLELDRKKIKLLAPRVVSSASRIQLYLV